MTVTKEYSEAFAEVLDIIKHLDDDEIEAIPLDFIKKLNANKSLTYTPNIDYTKPIEENNLKHTTKVLLTYMYSEFLATEEEKKEIWEKLEANDEKIREKYNVDVFEKKRNKEINNNSFQLVPVKKKKNIFIRLFERLKQTIKK